MTNRREFMSSAVSLAALTAAASVFGPSKVWAATNHKPLDPINPESLFGTTSSIWGRQHDIAWAIKSIAALGLQGIEPIRTTSSSIGKIRWRSKSCSMTRASRSSTAPTARKGSRRISSTPRRRRRRSRITWRSRATSFSLSTRRSGSATWAAARGRPERRSAQAAGRHAERDRPADDCHGHPLSAAPAYPGPIEREREVGHDGADRSQVRAGSRPTPGISRSEVATRRSSSTTISRASRWCISKTPTRSTGEHVDADAGAAQGRERLSQPRRWRRRLPGRIQGAARAELQGLGDLRSRRAA